MTLLPDEQLHPGGCQILRSELTRVTLGTETLEVFAAHGMPVERWRDHVFPDPRYRYEEIAHFPAPHLHTVNWYPRSKAEREKDPLNVLEDARRDLEIAINEHLARCLFTERSPERRQPWRLLAQARACLAGALENLRRWVRSS